MTNVLLRAFAFILTIGAGIAVRAAGLIDKNGGAALKQILLYVTLPAIIVTNFAASPALDLSLLSLCALGVLTNLGMLGAGMLLTRRRVKAGKALYLFCLPAYNIGAFCLPFVQSFLPPLGTVATCMFDLGNSVMCTGGSYAIAGAWLDEGGLRPGVFVLRLLSSPCIIAYLLMLALSLAGLRVPGAVLTLIAPMANANAFVAMFYLGVMFRLELKREYLGQIARLIALRHLFAACCACLVWFVSPFPMLVKQTLTLVLFAPMSAIAPAYTQICGGDAGKASAANSVSILLSIAELTALLSVMRF